MGVLNITPDSFYDGGLHFNPQKALERAQEIEDQGADILDVGAESSRPGADPVSEDEEWGRLQPVLTKIRKKIKIKISVDTYKYSVMHRVLDCGVNIINDIFAMRNDERIPDLLSRYSAGISLMHMRGTPQTMQSDTTYQDVVLEVTQMLDNSIKRATEAGVDPAAIAVDPGIGFGKSVDANFELLAHISKIKSDVQKPILIGISNKSFIKKTTGGASKSIAAAMNALHGQLMVSGADILRVHDIIDTVSVRDVYQKFIEAHSAGNT